MQAANGDSLKSYIPDSLDPGNPVRRVAVMLGATAGYFRTHDLNNMLEDANRLVRRFPEHSLVAAVAVGVMLGTAFRKR